MTYLKFAILVVPCRFAKNTYEMYTDCRCYCNYYYFSLTMQLHYLLNCNHLHFVRNTCHLQCSLPWSHYWPGEDVHWLDYVNNFQHAADNAAVVEAVTTAHDETRESRHLGESGLVRRLVVCP